MKKNKNPQSLLITIAVVALLLFLWGYYKRYDSSETSISSAFSSHTRRTTIELLPISVDKWHGINTNPKTERFTADITDTNLKWYFVINKDFAHPIPGVSGSATNMNTGSEITDLHFCLARGQFTKTGTIIFKRIPK